MNRYPLAESTQPGELTRKPILDRLRERREDAMKHLSELETAIAALEKVPDVQAVLDALAIVGLG